MRRWGENSNGRLGYGDTNWRGDSAGEMGDLLPAVDLGTGRTAVKVAAGQAHTCALLDNGSVKCWGYNGYWHLGLNDNADRGDNANEMGDFLAAVNLGVGRTATNVWTGDNYTCIKLDNGATKCWGRADQGQLGYDFKGSPGWAISSGGAAGLDYWGPVFVGVGRTIINMMQSYWAQCALLDNMDVKCWGGGNYGMQATGNTGYNSAQPGDMAALQPVNFGTGRTVTAISRINTTDLFCAILDNGALKCWGRNDYGQLGLANNNLGDEASDMGA